MQSSSIPDVTFDVGDSYAGLMPVYGENRNEKLFFWFFPTENDAGKDDIVIWLNGGPGCSSMEGEFMYGHFNMMVSDTPKDLYRKMDRFPGNQVLLGLLAMHGRGIGWPMLFGTIRNQFWSAFSANNLQG